MKNVEVWAPLHDQIKGKQNVKYGNFAETNEHVSKPRAQLQNTSTCFCFVYLNFY